MTPIRRFTGLDLATGLLAAVIAAIALWIFVAGPEGAVPMHFDSQGRPDRWGDRGELSGVVGFMALMTAGLGLPMGWYARRSPDPARARGLRFEQLINLLAIGGTTAFMLATILGPTMGLAMAGPQWLMAGVGILLILIGAGMGRVAPNPVIGVRTPWSFKSRLAWDRSNRLAGRLLFWTGVLAVIAAPIAPQPLGVYVFLVAILVAAVWSVIESWRVWRTDPDRQPF